MNERDRVIARLAAVATFGTATLLAQGQLPEELRVLSLPEILQSPAVLSPESTAIIVGILGFLLVASVIELVSPTISKKMKKSSNRDMNEKKHKDLLINLLSGSIAFAALLEIYMLLVMNHKYLENIYSREEIVGINGLMWTLAVLAFMMNNMTNTIQSEKD